jgi:hypothetical protein
VVTAYRLVFRHVAAGLTEKPYRSLIDWLTQAGAYKSGAGGQVGFWVWVLQQGLLGHTRLQFEG